MAATATSSSSAADSYIGSVISLTSKSEIRYEGVLFRINPEESSIGLRNVRSFGTEGRKKDGPQIPPSDKVYEHILFRGTDIKDLQVISSPPMQSAYPINNDPAIIQSHYSCPVTASVTFPSSVSGSLIDHNSYTSQHGLLGSTNFQGAMPSYQPGGTLDPWGASPAPPNANGVGLAMPMYWQGYYSVQNGLPHLHQQTLLTPPPGLVLPSSMQQQMQYPNFSPHFSTGASNLTEAPSSLLPTPTTSSTPHVVSTSLLASTIAPILPPVPSVTLASDILKTSTPSKAPNFSRPASIQTAALPSLASLTTSTGDVNHVVELVPNRSVSNVVGASNASNTVSTAPPLFTSALPQLRPAVLASISQSSQTPHKDVEVQVPSSPELSMADSTKSQPPTLGLPVPASFSTSTADVNHEIPAVSNKSTPSVVGKIGALTTGSSYVTSGGQQLASSSQSSQTPQKDVEVVQPNGASIKTHGHRGRGRGRGLVGTRTMTKFTEDFDFMAMNEKFKKEEVWGHLGKNSKSHGKEERDRSFSDEEDSHNGENAEASKIEPKPVYKKDDFFDTLSCTALNIESQNGRTRYSEQLKIDTETFGDFLKYPGGRGGRGPGRGGRSRGGGGYRGRGHGGRGSRGRSTRVA